MIEGPARPLQSRKAHMREVKGRTRGAGDRAGGNAICTDAVSAPLQGEAARQGVHPSLRRRHVHLRPKGHLRDGAAQSRACWLPSSWPRPSSDFTATFSRDSRRRCTLLVSRWMCMLMDWWLVGLNLSAMLIRYQQRFLLCNRALFLWRVRNARRGNAPGRTWRHNGGWR